MGLLLRGWGVTIDSNLPLPGAQLLPKSSITSQDHAALRIETGAAMLPAGGEVLGSYRLSGGDLLFTKPGLARFLCHRGAARLTVEPDACASPEYLSAMLIATAVPALLWMRGEMVLHAAAAVLPGADTAIAFAGPSGSGKSTLLQSLVDAGAECVSDDSLRLEIRSTGALGTSRAVNASGLPGSIALRSRSTATQQAAGLEAERSRIGVAVTQQRAQARLDAFVVIRAHRNPAGEPPLRLHGAEALAALLRNLHRPRVPRLLGQTAALLPRLAQLVEAVPVYSWCPQARTPGSARDDLKRIAEWADKAEKESYGGPR